MRVAPLPSHGSDSAKQPQLHTNGATASEPTAVKHAAATNAAASCKGTRPRVVRSARAYRAVSDCYEFDGWWKLWLAVCWFVVSTQVMNFSYPHTAGTYHSTVKALLTSYEPSPGANQADVRDIKTFRAALEHSLGFLSAYINLAESEGHPEGHLPLTEYDRVLFARLTLNLEGGCQKSYAKKSLKCYRDAVDSTTGAPYDAATLSSLVGPSGQRKIVLLDRDTTRADALARLAQLESTELPFLSTYAYEAVFELGVLNSLGAHYRSCYLLTVKRVALSKGRLGSGKVTVAIDLNSPRSTPLYLVYDDWVRLAAEIASLVFLFIAAWHELVQFRICAVWYNLNWPDDQKLPWLRRTLRLMSFFYAQPWNILDALCILNYLAWFIAYFVAVSQSYQTKVVMWTPDDYDRMKDFSSFRLKHLIWGSLCVVLIGCRMLPYFKTHNGLRIYTNTLLLTWHALKDLILFFAVVMAIEATLITYLFSLTGANPIFSGGAETLLNLTLIALGYLGYADYFNNDAPTFGAYTTIFQFLFWITVLMLVIVCQNVLLAVVANAYDEAREKEGEIEYTQFKLSLLRIWWFCFSCWHRWILRKTSYALFRELLAATQQPDVWTYKRVFTRWALADLPETRLLAQMYIEPTSDVLYLCSPWAWTRVNPMDGSQPAPWDEQLLYPMYTWADVTDSSSGKPRLLRLPPLYSASATNPPFNYNEFDPVFGMTEGEIDALLECVGACWERIRQDRVVAKFTGLGWSEEGRALLREGLLEVYRRHDISERTATKTRLALPSSSSGKVLVGSSSTKAIATLAEPPHDGDDVDEAPFAPGKAFGSGRLDGIPPLPAASAGPPAAHGKPRPAITFLNRRGRIAENLDMLWGEVAQLREQQQVAAEQQQRVVQQQAEIKALLEALLREQRGGGGGSARGQARGGSGQQLSLI